jgi:hypothetical protein
VPKANWGISRDDFENFDREKQFKPYTGPVPPSGQVFQWLLKKLQYFPGTREKNPQLRIGLELNPRRKEEKKYAGFFVMTFRAITPKTQFLYVPLCDALGVTATDFTDRTRVNEEGDVLAIGRWRNKGDQLLMAQLKDSEDEKGNPRKDIGWIGPVEDDELDDDELDEEIDEDDYIDDEDEEASDEYEDELEEEAPAPKRRAGPAKRARTTRPASRQRSARARSRVLEEDDPF